MHVRVGLCVFISVYVRMKAEVGLKIEWEKMALMLLHGAICLSALNY